MKTIITSIALMAATSAGAQTEQAAQGWSLRQCISYALEHNITVKQQDVTKQQQQNSD